MRPFAAEYDQLLLLDAIAQRYGSRPSALMGFAGVLALGFDALVALTGKEAEGDAMREVTAKGGFIFPIVRVAG